jgi:hypothetical protein
VQRKVSDPLRLYIHIIWKLFAAAVRNKWSARCPKQSTLARLRSLHATHNNTPPSLSTFEFTIVCFFGQWLSPRRQQSCFAGHIIWTPDARKKREHIGFIFVQRASKLHIACCSVSAERSRSAFETGEKNEWVQIIPRAETQNEPTYGTFAALCVIYGWFSHCDWGAIS